MKGDAWLLRLLWYNDRTSRYFRSTDSVRFQEVRSSQLRSESGKNSGLGGKIRKKETPQKNKTRFLLIFDLRSFVCVCIFRAFTWSIPFRCDTAASSCPFHVSISRVHFTCPFHVRSRSIRKWGFYG